MADITFQDQEERDKRAAKTKEAMEQRRLLVSQRKADEEKVRQADIDKKKREDGERRKREREEANTSKIAGVKKVRLFLLWSVMKPDIFLDGGRACKETKDHRGDREEAAPQEAAVQG